MVIWRKVLNNVQNIGEWLLIALMIFAAVFLLFNIPESVARVAAGGAVGPIQSTFGTVGGIVIYAVTWLAEALWLAWAKITHNAKQRKWAMFAIFVTHVFTIAIAIDIVGFGWHLIDNVLIILLSGWLWLRAKLQYDYITYEELARYDELD